MNDDERKVFVALWNERLDEIEPLSISLWLREYAQLVDIKDSDPAKPLTLRIDAKLQIASDTIEQLIKERDEARRLHCHMSAQFLYKSVELDTAKHVANSKGWDCFEKETQ